MIGAGWWAPNGTGKSSLLKIITGQVQPDDGTLTLRKRARVGYLPQELSEIPAGPLVQTVLRAVPGKDVLDERLAATEAQLGQATLENEQMELAQLLADLHVERDHFEERFGRHRAEAILLGLGFTTQDLERDTGTLSGGWRMRAALAALLLQDPDLLLLDEPTNHLDLPTLAWFDAFLKRSNKAFVLICHDREFLDSQIDHVISLEVEGLSTYPGSFEAYQAKRAEEYEHLLAAAEPPGAAPRPDAAVHRPLSGQGLQGAPGAEPDQADGEGGPDPAGAGARHRLVSLPPGGVVGPRGGHASRACARRSATTSSTTGSTPRCCAASGWRWWE